MRELQSPNDDSPNPCTSGDSPEFSLPRLPNPKTKKQMRTLREIAAEIRRDWKKVYFGAVPFLDALECMESPQAHFGADSGREIVLYFLSNATTWKGETARRIKAELKEALK